jgi:hypothetical protein
MPYINGRYHINPIMGQALEAAREAEAAMLALQQQASHDSADSSGSASYDDTCDPGDPSCSDAAAGQGPIHHVEIEATEVVPHHSGHAVRGFVARVHRLPAAPRTAREGVTHSVFDAIPAESRYSAASRSLSSNHSTLPPETHVFADHRDLMSFLAGELAKK